MDHLLRGRGALLDELVSLTHAGGHTVVVHGAGGFGKTAIALTLARRVARDVHVWWIDATNSRSLATDLREVASRAGASRSAVRQAWKGQRSAPDLLWSALEQMKEPWLLVVDNADDIAVLAAGDNRFRTGRGWIRTPSPLGTVLITSRDGNAESWGRQATIRHATALSRHDGAAILNELAPRAGNQRQAVRLADALDGLPLALYLAGRYLNSTATSLRLPGTDCPRTFDDYRATLRDHLADTITITAPNTDDPHHKGLADTWERSLDLLHHRGYPLARPLLRLLATFAPAPIPCALLDAAVLAHTPLFAGLTPTRLGTLLTALAGLGLVDLHRSHRGPDTITLHPLIRDITRRQPDVLAHHDDYSHARTALLHPLATHTSSTDPSLWTLWHSLLPHCEHETSSTRTPHRQRRALADIHHHAAGFAYEYGLHITAKQLYQQAMHTRLALLGSNHPDSLATRHNLIVLRAEHGDHNAARRKFEDILAHHTATLGANHPDTLNTRRNLACVHRDLDDLDTAQTELQQIADLQHQLLGATHPDTIITRYEIAVTLQHQGQTRTAGNILRGLLHDQRHLLGEHHSHTLITRHHLILMAGSSDIDPYRAELRQLCVLTTSALGAEHPVTLNVRNSCAVALHAARRDVAEAELQRIVTLQCEHLGLGHRETITAQHNLDAISHHQPDAPLSIDKAPATSVRAPLPHSPNPDFSLSSRRDHVRVMDLSTWG